MLSNILRRPVKRAGEAMTGRKRVMMIKSGRPKPFCGLRPFCLLPPFNSPLRPWLSTSAYLCLSYLVVYGLFPLTTLKNWDLPSMDGQTTRNNPWAGVSARWNASSSNAPARQTSSYVNFGADGKLQQFSGFSRTTMMQDDQAGSSSYLSSDVYISPPEDNFNGGSGFGVDGQAGNGQNVTPEDIFDESLSHLRLDAKRLHIHSNLGQGFFADTYQATYEAPEGHSMEVAVKRIVLASFRQQSDLALFVKEVGIWSRLDHPHLVQLLGYTINNAERYSVMELLGLSLHDALAQERQRKLDIPFDSKVSYAQHVASALAFMHDYNPPVLHRDLTPANVLLASDFSLAKVGDFGLAREALSEGMTMTSAVGNCVCMAPEVFNGGKYHASADVYSYGMLLYQLFINPADVCQGFSPQVWASLAAQERRRPPTEPLAQLGTLGELIQACWHHEPRARPTFRDIVEFLENP